MFLFVIEISWVFIQTRRPDFAEGGPKTKGGKDFLNTILDVCSNRGAKYDMWIYVSNGGRAPLAPSGDGPVLLYEYGFILVCNLGLFEIT